MPAPSRRWTRLHPALLFAGVFALALVVRLLVLWQVLRDPNANRLAGDGLAYMRWADAIASGDWVGSQVFYQAPLYTYFLAILKRWFALHETGIRIVQAIIGSAGCGMIALATRRLVSRRAGIIAGVLLGLYPAAISFDLQIDKPVLDVALVSALLWALSILLCGALGEGIGFLLRSPTVLPRLFCNGL